MFQAVKKTAGEPDWLRILMERQQQMPPPMDQRPAFLPPGFDPSRVPSPMPMPGAPGRLPQGYDPNNPPPPPPDAMQRGAMTPEMIEYLRRLLARGQ